jgi:PAT family beta-lactamase induction signal transducer AmpG
MGVAFFLFNMCISLLETMLPVFTIQEIGWTNEKYSNLFSSTSLVAGFLGIIAGGALADFFGKRRMLSIYLFLFLAVMVAMSLLKSYWATEHFITGFMGSYYTLYVFISIASFAIGMQLCWARISATQFTLYMAIANGGRSAGAAMLGPLKANLAWEHIFLVVAVMAVGSLLFVMILRMKKHLVSVDELEVRHLAGEADLLKRLAL